MGSLRLIRALLCLIAVQPHDLTFLRAATLLLSVEASIHHLSGLDSSALQLPELIRVPPILQHFFILAAATLQY